MQIGAGIPAIRDPRHPAYIFHNVLSLKSLGTPCNFELDPVALAERP